VFNGSGVLTSLAKPAQPGGGTVTYSFTAGRPGTYLYESGGGQVASGTPSLYSSPQVQVRMGLFGALIVRPAMGASFVYDRADSRFNPDTEFMALLSEIDPYLNAKVLKGTAAFNMNTYHPRYWLINGRGFPDSIADNFASWLPAQPYGSLATIHPLDPAINPYPSLTRFLSVGTEDYPFHPHGNNGKVIGRDGSPLAGPAAQDMSFDKFSVNIGPGQTWDVLFSWKDNEGYSPSNQVPASEPDLQNLTVGMFYSGSPYLGVQEELPPGVQTLNECGEFYIIAHNHALHQLTSWGVNMTGPITYTRVDPPLPNSCP
jgi:FtsP/CotA-like multicopper oxidase with cupredoxin domain